MKKSVKQEKTIVKQIKRRNYEGIVVDNCKNKTVKVLVETIKMHPKYKKQYTVHKKFTVHDEKQKTKAGDRVSFQECRPLSKTKRWFLLEVLEKTK